MEQGNGWSPYLYSVMVRCWNGNPQRRPTFAQLVAELQAKRDEPAALVLARGRGRPAVPSRAGRGSGAAPISDDGYEMPTRVPGRAPGRAPAAPPRPRVSQQQAPAPGGGSLSVAEKQERARAARRARAAAVAQQRSSEA